MDAFLSIERTLLIHHSTTRQPMSLGTLRFRTIKTGKSVSADDVAHVLAIWPEAYTVYELRGQKVIECAGLPHAADRRRAEFAKLWEKKENLFGSINSSCCARDSPEPLLPRPLPNTSSNRTAGRVSKTEPKRRILTGTQKQLPGRSITDTSSLLERIQAKEAKLKVQRSPLSLRKQTDAFLGSQVPKMMRVLSEMANAKDTSVLSFDIDRMMDIMRENLAKLGDDELQRCLELLSQAHPSFCSIVSSGGATFVKLSTASQPQHQRQNPGKPANASVEGPQSLTV